MRGPLSCPPRPESGTSGRGGGDLLRGGAGEDVLYGDAPDLFTPPAGSGPDPLLRLPAGRDTLDGGDGADALFGGGESDVFILRRGETAGDTIVDFSGAEGDGDTIRFEGFGPGASLNRIDGDTWAVASRAGPGEEFNIQSGAVPTEADYVFAG